MVYAVECDGMDANTYLRVTTSLEISEELRARLNPRSRGYRSIRGKVSND